MKRLVVVLWIGLASGGVAARDFTGNDLLRICEIEDFCNGLSLGLLFSKHPAVSLAMECVPREVSASQIADVIVKYLRERPEARHHPIEIVVTNAITDAWPWHRTCGE